MFYSVTMSVASRPRRPIFLILAGSAALSACSGSLADYPSLAPRPIEKSANAPEPAPPPLPTAADPALAARIAPIVAAAQKGHADFIAERSAAESAIVRARGASSESEAWVAAQQALSSLDTARGVVQSAAADMDTLRRDQAGAAPPDLAALQAAADQIAAFQTEEDAAVAALAARLPE
ncbi:hypothetical protein CLG96_11605 [Sphingomonas oleivorans]|uniref:Uncharacterized protein n=1 Tax=Sphingomonas oleivorans TaxID=1735121 RepID=A0A2T5FVK9_9SPHN|nr:hypothetical protein [Sphingomonas oleivorans]PTQ09816.1 hypothetical protein CLG96_11605 [Sphingomonas oleivorans]